MNTLRNYLQDEDGATAIEYCLVVILIAIPLVAAIEPLRDTLVGYYETIHQAFNINKT